MLKSCSIFENTHIELFLTLYWGISKTKKLIKVLVSVAWLLVELLPWVTCPRIMKICFGPNFCSCSIELYNDDRTSYPILWQVSQVDGVTQIIFKMLFQINIAFAEVLFG